MDKTNGKYECSKCNKIYSSYKSLWNHNKNFHISKILNNIIMPSNDIVTQSIDIIVNSTNIKENYNNLVCKNCNKEFSHRNNRWRHEKTCKPKISNNNNEIELEKIKLQQKEKDMDIEKIKLETVKLKLELKNNNKIINKNNTLNTNNGTINNNIIIKSIGNESVMSLTAAEIKEISTSGSNALLKVIQCLNFNKDRPENHSFCVTSLEGNHVTYHDNIEKQKIKVTKNEFFDRILLNSRNKLDEITIRLEFDENEQNKELYLGKLNNTLSTMFSPQNVDELKTSTLNKKILSTYNKKLNDLSYNNKDMVQKTWSQAKYEPPLEPMSDLESDSDSSSFSSSVDLNEAVRRISEKQKLKNK
jgi:hypothetical protein